MMTLRNMRENGVRSLAITCGAVWCNHHATLDVSGFADGMTVPSFGPRIFCTICGAIGADARPNWNERAQLCLYGHIPSGCCARAASGQTATAPVNVKPMRCEETRSPAALSAVGPAIVLDRVTKRKFP